MRETPTEETLQATQRQQQADKALQTIRQLQAKIRTNGRKFTREEMNER